MSCCAAVPLAAALEVGADPTAQILGLAHIEDRVLVVQEFVDARVGGEGVELLDEDLGLVVENLAHEREDWSPKSCNNETPSGEGVVRPNPWG